MAKHDKAKEIFGLHKIPDHILVKNLLVEKGQRESYIQELEYKVAEMQTKLSQYEKQ